MPQYLPVYTAYRPKALELSVLQRKVKSGHDQVLPHPFHLDLITSSHWICSIHVWPADVYTKFLCTVHVGWTQWLSMEIIARNPMDLRVNMTSMASHYAEQCTVILATNQLWKARLCGEIRLWQHRQVLCRHSGDDCPVLGADRKKTGRLCPLLCL
jgi:hypothetical protein